jgi:hypothetical protein
MQGMLRVTNGWAWRATGATLAASGDQAHRSTMQISQTCLDSQERRMGAPMSPRHDGTRRNARPTTSLWSFLFFLRNQWCGLLQWRKCKTTKETLSMLFTTIHLSLFLYKFHNGKMPQYSWACLALLWHSGATRIIVHWLMLEYSPETAESCIHFFSSKKV